MTMGPDIRTLEARDRPALEGFLQRHAEGAMPLLAQLQRGGIVCEGLPNQAHYLGAFDRGLLTGVLALCSNDLVMLQCPLPDVLTRLIAVWKDWFEGGCIGLIGPRAQVEQAAGLLGGEALPFRLNNTEQILTRDLQDPLPLLLSSQLVRPAMMDELEPLYGWRTAFFHETLSLPLTQELVEQARADLDAQAATGRLALLTHNNVTVGMGLIMTELAGVAQLGGLYVPPDLRQRGYGKALLAGLLHVAADRGNRKAMVMTTKRHVAINSAATANGFKPYGDFGIILFDQPVSPPKIQLV